MRTVRKLITLLCLACTFSVTSLASEETHWGTATDRQGLTVYTEKHSVSKTNGVLSSSETQYFDKDRKNLIATMKSDYSRSLAMPTYEFIDLRSTYREGLRFVDGKYLVYYQKPNEKEASKVLGEGKSVFSCQGWHYYLIENLSLLEKGDVVLRLVLPSELDFFTFNISKTKTNDREITVNLELSNWFLSMFAPKLRLVYDKTSKRLIEYEGVSNILDSNGKRQDITIRYSYTDGPEKAGIQ